MFARVSSMMCPAGVAALLSLASTASSAQTSNLDDVAGFDGMRQRWAELMDEFNVPGMAIAIVKDGEIAAIETFGERAPDGPPPTPDTIFYIASITKTYLATAICALADDGKVSLDDPVKKHLPRFALAGVDEQQLHQVTIRDLLCHRPGIGGGPIVMLDAYTGEITDDRYYQLLARATPGGQMQYSNVHYTLLGRIVEAVSGLSWRDYLEQRVFKPAGLTRTTGYASRMYGDADCAAPMERANGVDGPWQVCRLRKTDRTMHAAGGLGASAQDAARWLILHLNDGEIDAKRILSANRAREMRTLASRFNEKRGSIRVMEGFGLGWQVGSFHGTPLCSHGGGYEGAAAYYAILPEHKSGFALLMNAGNLAGGLLDVIAVDILDRLMDGDERIDVRNVYLQSAAEDKRTAKDRYAQLGAELAKPFELTRPLRDYAGRYQNQLLGTLTFTPHGERLRVVMGECELDVAPAGPDAVRVLRPTAEGVLLSFIVSPQGSVSAVSLNPNRQPRGTTPRIYKLPLGKHEQLMALLSRDDVPILIERGSDQITIHATPAQHQAIAAFILIIDPDNESALAQPPGADQAPAADTVLFNRAR